MTAKTQKGVAAAGHRLTAEAAAHVLREGGNAVDAAIAAVGMACVAEPVLASPGGGGFAMVRDGASGAVQLYDFFVQTPKQQHLESEEVCEIHADFGTATQAFHIGPATSATPGFCAGLKALHRDRASIGLRDLLEPAASAARNGIKITEFQHYLATVVFPILTATPAARALYASGGALLEAGETFRNPHLANAIETIGAGEERQLEDAMIAQQAGRGHLTEKDFGSYTVEVRAPLEVDFDGAKIFLNPAPAASGRMISHALQVMDGRNAEAMAAALDSADRNRTAILEAPASYRGTTHISVLDRNGNACAVTTSNGEGNGELVPGFGYMTNNMLGEEDVNPHRNGEWPLDVRMSSMMCPSIVCHQDGSLTALGSGGSNRIRSAIFHVLVRLLRRGFSLEKAIRAPRLHIEAGHLDIEGFFKQPALDALTTTFSDHRVWPEANMFYGGVHGAEMLANGSFAGHGDARRDGVAIIVD